jgi:hypothetical protein
LNVTAPVADDTEMPVPANAAVNDLFGKGDPAKQILKAFRRD